MTTIKKSFSGALSFNTEDPESTLVSLTLPDDDAIWLVTVFLDYDANSILIDEKGIIQSFDDYQKQRRYNASIAMCEKNNLSKDEYIMNDGLFDIDKLVKEIEAEDLIKDPQMYEYYGGREVSAYYYNKKFELKKEYLNYCKDKDICYASERIFRTNISKYPWCKSVSSPYTDFSINQFNPTTYMITKSQSDDSRTLNINFSDVKSYTEIDLYGKTPAPKPSYYRTDVSKSQILGIELDIRELTIVAHRIE